MKRVWAWLKAEWALCKKQAACSHERADGVEVTICPDCGYDTDIGNRAW